jgi:hypothetical protein
MALCGQSYNRTPGSGDQGVSADMQLIRLLAFCFLFVWASTSSATTSLSFNGDGYDISMEIGHDVKPVVASLYVRTPRVSQGVHLYGNFKTEIFDIKKRALLIQFTQKEKGKEPGSFTLTVEGDVGTLRIDDQVITSPFNWEM